MDEKSAPEMVTDMDDQTEAVDDVEVQCELICGALVREIGRAQRWSAVKEAWDALLSVRRMARALLAEQEYLSLEPTKPNRSRFER